MNRRRRSAIVRFGLLAAFGALALSTPALAGTSTRCSAPLRHPFPSASGLTASHTGCATARVVVERIQGVWQTTNGTLPGWFRTSRHVPAWHCRYVQHGLIGSRYHTASCTSGHARVTVRLNA
jgi:hypothetical protein